MQDSNEHLSEQLEKTKKTTQGIEVLYKDILSSDGNLTITKDEFTRLCIESTSNSLYALPRPKVCWLVMKEKNTLMRVEGVDYVLPLKYEDRVEADAVVHGIELFDVYYSKDKVLVVLKEKGKEPMPFMVQGIRKPKPPKQKDVEGKENQQKTGVSATSNTGNQPTVPTLNVVK